MHRLPTLTLLLVLATTPERAPGTCVARWNVGHPTGGGTPPTCSCVSVGNSVAEARARSSAVFIGRVDSLETVASPRGSGDTTWSPPLVRARLRVVAAWPGARADSLAAARHPDGAAAGRGRAATLADSLVWVTTPDSGPSCGFHFKRGAEYLVYANGPHTDLWTTKCSRTRRLGRARGDLERLGPPLVDRLGGSHRPE